MPFSDLALSQRLERAEGTACVEHARARRRLEPASGADWLECAGALAVFDGADSPITQTFGLGVFEPLTAASLEALEQFFQDRAAPVLHEVSPHAGVQAMNLLCARNYRPVEISNVLYRALDHSVEQLAAGGRNAIRVRAIGAEEGPLWARVSARGWSHEHPELMDFLLKLGAIATAREHMVCFIAELDGQPGAAGALAVHEGVALFAGSATVPEMRRGGLQSALLEERMRYAFAHQCDLAMMVALPGSDSQRNAERQGFQIAYTRTKWGLGVRD